MKRTRQRAKPAVELIEEATHLLRLSPATVLGTYYVGALPFVLALLFFWADMSRSAFAYKHCAEAALGLALLYIWMKCWQAVFADQLHARLCGRPASPLTWRRLGRIIAAQSVIQPSSLFTLPLAAVIMLPFGWLYGFYHNASLFGAGDEASVREVARKSWRQSMVWPGQNHTLIAALYLFGQFVFLNVASAILLLPALLKILFGAQTTFSMSGMNALNTTFLFAACGITHLVVNPLMKASYVLRCFYGESLQSAEDLKAELQSVWPQITRIAALVLLLLSTVPAAAEQNPQLASDLDHSITEVINKPEYTWRMPREKPPPIPDEQKSLIARFLDAVTETLGRWWKAVTRWVKKVSDWIIKYLSDHFRQAPRQDTSRTDWMTTLHILLFALVTLAVCALVFLVLRVWQRRRPAVEAVGELIAPAPDLTDENVAADLLPTEGWLAQARELMARGELRLALRALYLASLAQLAQQELIVIAKFKSNRDYERELQRRAHSRREILAAFEQNMLMFESAWYGMHDVTQTSLDQFTDNFEAIRGRVES